MKSFMNFIPLVVFAALLGACASPGRNTSTSYFEQNVKPVFEQHCLRCHTGQQPPAGLNLSDGTHALASRHRSGRAFIVPGQPEQSLMLTAIRRNGTHPRTMPRADISLTDDQIGTLREWIEDGAHWPAGKAGQLHHVATGENR